MSATSAAADEGRRQQALDAFRIVDSLPEQTYQDIVRIAAGLCDTPIALLSLVDRDRQWFKAQLGFGAPQTRRSEAICDHAIRTPDRLMEIQDLHQDSRFAGLPVANGDIGARFYAGMPLVTDEGAALGTVCVLDTRPRELAPEQRAGLEALSRVTMKLLDARREDIDKARQAVLATAPAVTLAPGSTRDAAPGYRIVILEIQGLAALAATEGERALARRLDILDRELGAIVGTTGSDTLDRVTGAPEFIAVLRGADAEAKSQRLRAAAEAQRASGLTVLVAESVAARADEPMPAVFLRADEALSREKDRHRGLG